MLIELIIFRHGQTEGNVRDLIVGNRESELTELGKEQAEKIGKELYIKYRHRRFDAFFSSPLSRAMNTTAIVARRTNHQNNIVIK